MRQIVFVLIRYGGAGEVRKLVRKAVNVQCGGWEGCGFHGNVQYSTAAYSDGRVRPAVALQYVSPTMTMPLPEDKRSMTVYIQ